MDNQQPIKRRFVVTWNRAGAAAVLASEACMPKPGAPAGAPVAVAVASA